MRGVSGLTGLLGIVLAVQTASAASAASFVSSRVLLERDGVTLEATDVRAFDDSVTIGARLSTAFLPSSIEFDGAASLSLGDAQVQYELVFDVEESAPYVFEIRLETFQGLFGVGGDGEAEMALVDSAGQDVFRLFENGEGIMRFTESGVLTPDEYTLLVSLVASGNGESVGFTKTAFTATIPEPGTASLVTLGLVALAAQRRR